MSAAARVGRAGGLLVRQTRTSVLVLGTEEDVTILRDTAMAVWAAFGETRTVAEAADTMAARYGVEAEEVLSDILPFIETLVSKGLLVLEPPERPERRP